MTELEILEQKMAAMKAELADAKAAAKALARKSKRVVMTKSFADYKHDVIDKKSEGISMIAVQEYESYVQGFNKKNTLSMEEAIKIMENPTVGRPGLLSQGTFFRELAAVKDGKKVRITNHDTGKREGIYARIEVAALIPEPKTQAEIALGL